MKDNKSCIKKIMQTGSYDIIDAGTLISYSEETDIVIHYDLEGFSFSIKMSFLEDSEKKDFYYAAKQEDKNIIHFQLYNFKNSFGSGNAEPIRIAVHENKDVYFKFWVIQLGNGGSYKVDYTLYRGL